MAKVLICFEGTFGDGKHLRDRIEVNKFDDDVIRIYIAGCKHPQVGGADGIFNPKLEIGAANVSTAFDENGNLDLDKLKLNFGKDGLADICGKKVSGKIKIDEIILEGYSRGAISACATARHLDKHDIPMHIIADQPVPGTSKYLKNDYRYMRECKNIRSATTFFASMDARADPHYFKQLVINFPDSANPQMVLLPHQRHLQSLTDSPLHAHMNKIFAEHQYSAPSADGKTVMDWYKKNPQCYFTPAVQMQNIYGGKGIEFPKDPIYIQMQKEKALMLVGKEVSDNEALAVLALKAAGFTDYEFVLNNPAAANAVCSFRDFSRSATQIKGLENTAETFFKNMCQSISSHTGRDGELEAEMKKHAKQLNDEMAEKASDIKFTRKSGNKAKEADSTKPFAEVFSVDLEKDITRVCAALIEAKQVQAAGQESSATSVTAKYKGHIQEMRPELEPSKPSLHGTGPTTS